MKISLLLSLIVAVTAFGQGSPSPTAPELMPLAAKHTADLAAVEQQRTTALAPHLTPYAVALNAAEKDALARSQLGGVAAVQQERETMRAGKIGDLIGAPYPDKLPATLKASRDAVFESFKRIEADLLKQRQKVDADYLRALAALQAQSAGKTALLAQIKAESDAVLDKPVTHPEGEVEVTTKTGKLINGDFSQADGNGFPVGWKLLSGRMENSPPDGETYKVMQENGRSFVHTAFAQRPKGKELVLAQVVEVPTFAKKVEIKFQYRGSLSNKGLLRMGLSLFDKTNPDGDKVHDLHTELEPAAGWKTFANERKLDGREKNKQVKIWMWVPNPATGFVDYSRVELHFK